MTGDPKLDAIFTFLVAPFVAGLIGLVVAAVVLAEWIDRRRKGLAPLSPETEAAREALHRAAWGGGER